MHACVASIIVFIAAGQIEVVVILLNRSITGSISLANSHQKLISFTPKPTQLQFFKTKLLPHVSQPQTNLDTLFLISAPTPLPNLPTVFLLPKSLLLTLLPINTHTPRKLILHKTNHLLPPRLLAARHPLPCSFAMSQSRFDQQEGCRGSDQTVPAMVAPISVVVARGFPLGFGGCPTVWSGGFFGAVLWEGVSVSSLRRRGKYMVSGQVVRKSEQGARKGSLNHSQDLRGFCFCFWLLGFCFFGLVTEKPFVALVVFAMAIGDVLAHSVLDQMASTHLDGVWY